MDLSVAWSALVAKRKRTIIQRKSALILKFILPPDAVVGFCQGRQSR